MAAANVHGSSGWNCLSERAIKVLVTVLRQYLE